MEGEAPILIRPGQWTRTWAEWQPEAGGLARITHVIVTFGVHAAFVWSLSSFPPGDSLPFRSVKAFTLISSRVALAARFTVNWAETGLLCRFQLNALAETYGYNSIVLTSGNAYFSRFGKQHLA